MLTKDDIRGLCALTPTPTKPNGGGWDATDSVDLDEAASLVEKHSHDAFNGTRLVSVLDELGITPGAGHTVLVAGVATHICVACGVIGLSVRNYQPVLVADCSASGTERQEELAYQLFSEHAYSYNVRLSTSDRLAFAPTPVHA